MRKKQESLQCNDYTRTTQFAGMDLGPKTQNRSTYCRIFHQVEGNQTCLLQSMSFRVTYSLIF